MTKEEIINKLELELHPSEGGYFRRTYESSQIINSDNRNRRLLTSIYYMLTSDSPTGYLHRNKSDIIHFYHSGSPIKYITVAPDGKLSEAILGPDIANGETPQLLVRGGDWKASRLSSGDYGLISEAVSPGFEYDDNEIAGPEIVSKHYPDLVAQLSEFIKTQ